MHIWEIVRSAFSFADLLGFGLAQKQSNTISYEDVVIIDIKVLQAEVGLDFKALMASLPLIDLSKILLLTAKTYTSNEALFFFGGSTGFIFKQRY